MRDGFCNVLWRSNFLTDGDPPFKTELANTGVFRVYGQTKTLEKNKSSGLPAAAAKNETEEVIVWP